VTLVTALLFSEFALCSQHAFLTVKIEHVAADGTTTVLKEKLSLLEGEVIDASRMSVTSLNEFYEKSFNEAKAEGVLLSLHLKATMMKVSDPIIFGHAVKVSNYTCV